MIYTTYFAKVRSLPKGVTPIAICAKAPSGYHGVSYKSLAPQYSFYSKWKVDHDDEYFTMCYKDQVLRYLNPARVVSELYEIAGTGYGEGDIALVCYEKASDFCHRHLVAEWLRENGYNCTEFIKDKENFIYE